MSTSTEGVYRLPVSIRILEDVDISGTWLSQGWRDFRSAPGVSLAYGGTFVVIALALTLGFSVAGLGALILPIAGGFAIVAPILVVGLYDVSRRLEAGLPATLTDCFGAFSRSASQLSAMGVVLLLCCLVWVLLALLLFALIFGREPPPLDAFIVDIVFSIQGALLLILGSIVGACLTAAVFSLTAVSVPLIYDRPIDVLTAIGVSLLVVRGNVRVMFGWAAMIALITALGIATAFIGLAVGVPVLAYATWHAYRSVITDGPIYADDAQLPPVRKVEDAGAVT
ncbi:MAG: DUF2189 domain-containing protein [Rhodospirillales bacterium]|nr:DUF2189 domain-containing protein [Rhodospirillales bacterium]